MNHLLQTMLEEYPLKKMQYRCLERHLNQNAAENVLRIMCDPEWYAYLRKRLSMLEKELSLLESAIDRLPDSLRETARMLLLEDASWDEACARMHISRMTLSRYRKQALEKLSEAFALHEQEYIGVLLS